MRKTDIIENFFVRHRDKFGYIHLGMFVVFVLLILIPPFLPMPSEDATIRNNFVLFAKFIIWGVWFPMTLLSVIFFGRLWCGLFCPQGALSEYAGRFGLNRPIPRWLRWDGMPIVSFIVITTLAQLVGARDYALPAMEVLGGTMLVAALTGFLYTSRRRAWCRHLCPIGPLLGIFSRLGAIGFERNGGDGKGCICPTFINTQTKTASSNCIECFRCVSPVRSLHGESNKLDNYAGKFNKETSNGASSDKTHSLHIKIRRPGLEVEDIKNREQNIWEVVFLFSATGLALGAFHWQVNRFYIQFKQALGGLLLNMGLDDFIGRSGPWWLMVNFPEVGEVFNWLDFISISAFMLWSMVLVAGVLFLLTFLSAFLIKEKEPLINKITRMGYLYAPVALTSIVIGLGLILFQSMIDMDLSKNTVRAVQAVLFTGGSIWSAYLAVRLQGKWSPAIIPNIIGIAFIALAWQRVLF